MCLCTLDKESNGGIVCDGFLVKTLFQIRQCQRGNCDALFTPNAKGNATGNEYFHVRTGPQQDLKRWSRLDNLLEIVQNQQYLFFTQKLLQLLRGRNAFL